MVSPASLMSPSRIQTLDRGGALVTLPNQFNIQFGTPPETVHDAKALGKKVGMYVIDPHTMIDRRGRTQEPEFPMYDGFFRVNGLKSPVKFATLPGFAPHLDRILRTSFNGPQWKGFSNDTIAKEYPQGADTPGFPDMVAELAFWAGGFSIDQLRKIIPIQSDGLVIEGARILSLGNGKYQLFFENQDWGVIDMNRYAFPELQDNAHARSPDPKFQAVRYQVLYEGRTCLIPIHSESGFDKGGTSGHMLWNNGKVVLVDPPADILTFLMENQIPLECIDGIVLTHVHGDHDAGTLQILMAGRKINLYTTASIERMYIEKLHAATAGRVSRTKIKKYWKTTLLKMKTPISVNGLIMKFFHGFHSIPAFGYEILSPTGGKPLLSYSGDTYNDPLKIYGLVRIKDQREGPIASRMRAWDIAELPFRAVWEGGGIAIHEQGAFPLHTPVETILTQIELIRERGATGQVFAYHSSNHALEQNGVQPLGDGKDLSHILDIPIQTSSIKRHAQVVRSLQFLPPFHGIDEDLLQQAAEAGQIDNLRENEKIIEEGELGDRIYLVLDGRLKVGRNIHKSLSRLPEITNGLIGEGALFGHPRNANVTSSVNDTRVMSWTTQEFREIFKDTPVLERLKNLREARLLAYEIVSNSPNLTNLHQQIFDGLLMIGKPEIIKKDQVMIKEGAERGDVFLVVEGDVAISSGGRFIALRGPGEIIGEMALIENKKRSATVTAVNGPVTVLRFPADEMKEIIASYPSLQARLNDLIARRKK